MNSDMGDMLVGSSTGPAASTSGSNPGPPNPAGGHARFAKVNRASKACDPCAKVKMRCKMREGSGSEPPCIRCAKHGYICTFLRADTRAAKKRAGSTRPSTSTAEGGRSVASSSPSQASRSPPPGDGLGAADASNLQTSLDLNSLWPMQAATSSTWLPPPPPPGPPQVAENLQSLLHIATQPQSQATPQLGNPFNDSPARASDILNNAQASASSIPAMPTLWSKSTGSSIATTASRAESAALAVSQLSNPLGLLVAASFDVPKPPGPGNRTQALGRGHDAIMGQQDRSGGEGAEEGSGSDSVDSAGKRAPPDIYFRPAGSAYTLKRKSALPAAYRVLSKEQIDELFNLFYSHWHIHAPIVDRDHGSPEQIAGRSHLLFHAICGVAMRRWDGPDTVRRQLLEIIATDLKAFSLERTLETVQANLLCATWNPVSPQHMDLDEQYLRVGHAVRMAMDLRLHETDTPEAQSDVPTWVVRSQRRTWALCFIFDAKLAAHRGRQCYTPDVGLLGLAKDGYADDRRMISSVEWCRIVLRICGRRQRIANRPASTTPETNVSQKDAELEECAAIDTDLLEWKDRWTMTFSGAPAANVHALLARTRLYFFYASILNYATSLQSICEDEPAWTDSVYANRYIDAVNRLLYTFSEDFGLHGIAGYLSDLHFTYVAFTAVSLIHSMSIGVGRSSHNAPASMRLLHRVADLIEASAGQQSHNLANQAYFLRTVMKAKLDDNGLPRLVDKPTVETSFSEQGDQDIFAGAPAPMNEDPWGLAVPVSLDSLDAFFNYDAAFSNAYLFDPTFWDPLLRSSRQASPAGL